MNINTETLVSITEANQNFSKVARLVDQRGSAIILKNNKPKYIITEFSVFEKDSPADDEDVKTLSDQLIKKNAKVYQELAK